MEIPKGRNQLKTVLAGTSQTHKWLTEQFGKDPVTVSKWCTTPLSGFTRSQKFQNCRMNIRELLIDSNNW